MQLALFLPSDAGRTLADDATGRIVYVPEVVDFDLCGVWFAELRASIDWQRERRPMYDRIVDVPRLTAHFGIGEPVPPALHAARQAVEAYAGVHFNTVGLNLYRDGHDSVAMHSDHTEELIAGSPVALLSLGGTRRMRIHTKARPRRVFNVDLEPGSILLMSGAAQENYEHGVPKTRNAAGERISLAFRQRPKG